MDDLLPATTRVVPVRRYRIMMPMLRVENRKVELTLPVSLARSFRISSTTLGSTAPGEVLGRRERGSNASSPSLV